MKPYSVRVRLPPSASPSDVQPGWSGMEIAECKIPRVILTGADPSTHPPA